MEKTMENTKQMLCPVCGDLMVYKELKNNNIIGNTDFWGCKACSAVTYKCFNKNDINNASKHLRKVKKLIF